MVMRASPFSREVLIAAKDRYESILVDRWGVHRLQDHCPRRKPPFELLPTEHISSDLPPKLYFLRLCPMQLVAARSLPYGHELESCASCTRASASRGLVRPSSSPVLGSSFRLESVYPNNYIARGVIHLREEPSYLGITVP